MGRVVNSRLQTWGCRLVNRVVISLYVRTNFQNLVVTEVMLSKMRSDVYKGSRVRREDRA